MHKVLKFHGATDSPNLTVSCEFDCLKLLVSLVGEAFQRNFPVGIVVDFHLPLLNLSHK